MVIRLPSSFRSRKSVRYAPTIPMRPVRPPSTCWGFSTILANGTDVVIVRPFNHAGPRQSTRYVLAGLALQVAEVEKGHRECLEIGNLNVVRDFVDVRDVIRAYRLLGQKGQAGEIYNLGSGRGTRIADALEYLRSRATRTIPIRVDTARVRPVDQPLLIADSSKLKAAIGWEPRYTIEQTLTDMLDFSRKLATV